MKSRLYHCFNVTMTCVWYLFWNEMKKCLKRHRCPGSLISIQPMKAIIGSDSRPSLLTINLPVLPLMPAHRPSVSIAHTNTTLTQYSCADLVMDKGLNLPVLSPVLKVYFRGISVALLRKCICVFNIWKQEEEFLLPKSKDGLPLPGPSRFSSLFLQPETIWVWAD